jgi:hypothetical protein
VALTLLTALDLPWVADGLQRDGPQVREPVDDTLRELLLAHALPFAVVGGQAEQRVAQALAAWHRCCGPALRQRPGSSQGWKMLRMWRSAGTANVACPSVNGP